MMAVLQPPQHCCFARDIFGLLHTELIGTTVVHVPVVERFGLGHIEVAGAGILHSHMVHTQAGVVHTLGLAGLVHTLGLAGLVHILAWLVHTLGLAGLVHTLGLAGLVHILAWLVHTLVGMVYTEVELWRRGIEPTHNTVGWEARV